MEKLEGARFCLEGLNCAHCAGKIEEEIGTLSGVKSARVDFAQQRLVLETLEGEGERIFEEAKRLIKEIEPHVTLLKQEEAGHGREGELALKEALKSPRFLLFALGSLFFCSCGVSQGRPFMGCLDLSGGLWTHRGRDSPVGV